MQKHVYLLNETRAKQRGGFALIAAVFLLLIISILLLKMMGNSSENAQQVVNDYLYEQAELLAYGATEYTLLQISATDPNNCVTHLDMQYPPGAKPFFTITTDISYIWEQNSVPAGCPAIATVSTPEQNGTVIIDVVVKSNNANIGIHEPIRFSHRTLQKL
jgi:competence protein ComGC